MRKQSGTDADGRGQILHQHTFGRWETTVLHIPPSPKVHNYHHLHDLVAATAISETTVPLVF